VKLSSERMSTKNRGCDHGNYNIMWESGGRKLLLKKKKNKHKENKKLMSWRIC